MAAFATAAAACNDGRDHRLEGDSHAAIIKGDDGGGGSGVVVALGTTATLENRNSPLLLTTNMKLDGGREHMFS